MSVRESMCGCLCKCACERMRNVSFQCKLLEVFFNWLQSAHARQFCDKAR